MKRYEQASWKYAVESYARQNKLLSLAIKCGHEELEKTCIARKQSIRAKFPTHSKVFDAMDREN